MPNELTLQSGSSDSIVTMLWLDWIVGLIALILVFVIAFKLLQLATRLTDRVAPPGSEQTGRAMTAARFTPVEAWAPQHSMTVEQAIEQVRAGHLKGFTSDGRWYILID
ncbi:MAG: hypothetical protein AAGI68_12570 [Planctomycetota bacterium]